MLLEIAFKRSFMVAIAFILNVSLGQLKPYNRYLEDDFQDLSKFKTSDEKKECDKIRFFV